MTQKYLLVTILLPAAFVMLAMISRSRRDGKNSLDENAGAGAHSKSRFAFQIGPLGQGSNLGSIHPKLAADHLPPVSIDVRKPEHAVLLGETTTTSPHDQYESKKTTGSALPDSLHDGVNRIAKGIGLDPSVLIAIAMTLVSCTVTSLGLTLQKLSHVAEDMNQGVTVLTALASNPPYFLRLRWAFGLFVYVVGHIIGLVALGMGPQSILSSLNCWTMVMTFVYGVMLLDEKVQAHRVVGSVLCCVGSLVLVYARPASAKAPTAPEWFWRLGSADFLVFLASICLVSCIVARYISVALRWALLAAAISWLSVVGAKGIAGIALAMDSTLWQSWVLLAMTVSLAFSNIHYLNMALQHGEMTLIVPFYEAIALSGQAVVGGVFFREFSSFHTILQIASFSMGLLLISCGLISMAGHENNQEGEVEVDENGKSETLHITSTT